MLGILITLLIVYNNHLLFLVQARLLKKHILKEAPVYTGNLQPGKINFCSLRPYSKVWAHRVNTIDRFLFLAKDLQGFEMDIFFNERGNFLDVRHPPANTINLSFEKYLELKESNDKMFWLDVKNLSNGNADSILNCLNGLDKKYQLRERIIIESNNIYPLSKISKAGYFTSYYYDTESYSDFLLSGNESSRKEAFDKIDAVSQDVLIYDTLVQKFPSKPRLTWALSFKNYLSDSLFTQLDQDNDLLIYLVNIKSPKYR